MRITDSLRLQNLQQNIESGLSNLNSVQQQLATGKQLNTPSDDPAGASQAMLLRASLVDNAQYQRDNNQAKSFLSASDAALSSASDLIVQAKQIATQGASSTQSQASMTALSQQVDGIIHQLTQVANTDLHGKYLFGGARTQTAPYTDPGTGPVYGGDTGTISSVIGPNNVMTLNTPGSSVFDGLFATLKTLKTNLSQGNFSAVSGNIDDLSHGLDNISATRAVLGAKMNQVDSTQQQLGRAQNDTQGALSNIEDVDLAQAYVQLQSAQNVYQASLATTAKAYQYSLMDYLH